MAFIFGLASIILAFSVIGDFPLEDKFTAYRAFAISCRLFGALILAVLSVAVSLDSSINVKLKND